MRKGASRPMIQQQLPLFGIVAGLSAERIEVLLAPGCCVSRQRGQSLPLAMCVCALDCWEPAVGHRTRLNNLCHQTDERVAVASGPAPRSWTARRSVAGGATDPWLLWEPAAGPVVAAGGLSCPRLLGASSRARNASYSACQSWQPQLWRAIEVAGITCLVEPQRAMAPCWLYGTAQGPVGFAGGILAWQDRAKMHDSLQRTFQPSTMAFLREPGWMEFPGYGARRHRPLVAVRASSGARGGRWQLAALDCWEPAVG